MVFRMSRAVFAIVFVAVGLALALGGLFLGSAHGIDAFDAWPLYVVALGVVVFGVVYARETRSRSTVAFVKASAPADEGLGEAVPGTISPSAYRGVVTTGPQPTNGSRARIAPVSAATTVIAIVACSALTALVLPALLSLPRWVEVEVVLGAWWLVWAVVLSVLAYRGRPLDREYALGSATPAEAQVAPEVAPEKPSRWKWSDALSLLADGEGLLLLVVGAVIGLLALAATTLVVDIAAPLVFVVAFSGVRLALRRSLAARDRGQLVPSAAHGVAWATCYLAPLAAVVGLVHLALGR